MDTIPFKVHDPDAMLTETQGLLQLYDDRLRLQLETKDSLVGQFKKNTEVNIPLREISSAKLETGWFKTELSVRVRDLALVADCPGSKLGQIRLRFKKAHREAVEDIADMMMESLEQLRLAWEEDGEGSQI